jgi:DNA-binding MarR family transcriptional regulator
MVGVPTQPSAPDPGPGLVDTLHRLAVETAAVDVSLARHLGLSSVDYLALKHVMARTDPLGPVELGRLLGISSGSATVLVDRLERSGHLTRRAHPHDRRRRLLSVTPRTRSRVLADLETLGHDVAALAAPLSGRDRRTVTDFLSGLADVYRAHGG